jgi:chemotaxis protein CheD
MRTAAATAPADAWTGAETPQRRFYYDRRLKATVISVVQGQYYVTANPNEYITTVLGSCIAVCIRDPDIGMGGMNHFMLPDSASADTAPLSEAMRYGSYSLERLINAIMRFGGRRDRLEIKAFGGASTCQPSSQVGERNIQFIENYLRTEGLSLAASDLGGLAVRRVRYHPSAGRAFLRDCKDSNSLATFARESNIAPDFGKIFSQQAELFNVPRSAQRQ